jgi:uncharacterized protein YfiM (DUF2279 family)
MRRAWLTAVLAGCTMAAASGAFADAVAHPVAASTPATVAGAEMTQPEPATTIGAGEDMMSFEESTAATCEDFGFFAADKRADCDKACHKGKKCAKKEMCGDGQCPPPGYCWKCPN